jgi:glutamyl-tRNA reductase
MAAMPAHIVTLGLNHVSAPVSVREKVSFPLNEIQPALAGLRSAFGKQVHEAALLSTCNRTELYCAVEPAVVERLPEWLADVRQLQPSHLQPHVYKHSQEQAVRHAFRVASGLDSMVLGEPQILGQLKDAVRVADASGSLGTVLHQLFQRSFAVAKDVRTQTAIGEQSVSMAAAAVRLAEQVFGDLAECAVLFIGAGEMIELCAAHFAARNPRRMAVANRTRERGEWLASRIHAEVLRLADIPDRLADFDVVVSCTASTLPIVGLGMVERASRQRKRRPMVMVDLAVPRDIEPEVGQLEDVYLHTVDDLAQLVQTATEARRAAVGQAEVIIDSQVRDFLNWLDRRSAVPLIQDLEQSAAELREAELDRARKALARGDDPNKVLEQLAHQLTRKFLHPTLAELNRADAPQREQLQHWVPRLFPRRGQRHH